MRNYQRKKNNPYQLPHTLYMRMLYLVRDYPRLMEERRDILYGSSPSLDGMPRGTDISTPTESRAIALAAVEQECSAVEQALREIPEEYRAAVLDNITKNAPFPYIAGESTWRRWRARFLYYVARNLHYTQ